MPIARVGKKPSTSLDSVQLWKAFSLALDSACALYHHFLIHWTNLIDMQGNPRWTKRGIATLRRSALCPPHISFFRAKEQRKHGRANLPGRCIQRLAQVPQHALRWQRALYNTVRHTRSLPERLHPSDDFQLGSKGIRPGLKSIPTSSKIPRQKRSNDEELRRTHQKPLQMLWGERVKPKVLPAWCADSGPVGPCDRKIGRQTRRMARSVAARCTGGP